MKNITIKLILSAMILLLTYIIPIKIINFIFILLACFVLIEETIKKVILNIKNKVYFSKEIIVCIITLFFIFLGMEKEVLLFFIFYTLDNEIIFLFLEKNKKKILDDFDYRKEKINLKTPSGKMKATWEDIKEGDIIFLQKGDLLCVDAICLSKYACYYVEKTDVYESVSLGEQILSGTVLNCDCCLKVTADYQNSIYNKMMENMINIKNTESIIKVKELEKKYDSFLLILLGIITFFLLFIVKITFKSMFMRILSMATIFTTSPLLFFVPFLYFIYLCQLKEKGIYFTKINILEKIKEIKTVIFSKMGVVTTDKIFLTKIIPVYETKEEVLRLAAYAEYGSTHKIASVILKEYDKQIETEKIISTKDIEGMGRYANIEGREVYIGTKQLFEQLKITYPKVEFLTPTCMLAVDGTYVATFVFSEEIKESAYLTSSLLREQEIEKIVFISSGEAEQIKKIGNRLSINESYACLNPLEKEEVLKMYEKENPTMYVDAIHINDHLKGKTSISVLLKGKNADIILLDDNLQNLACLKKYSNHFLKYSFYITLSYFLLKFILCLLAILGICTLEVLMEITFFYTFMLCNILLRRLR